MLLSSFSRSSWQLCSILIVCLWLSFAIICLVEKGGLPVASDGTFLSETIHQALSQFNQTANRYDIQSRLLSVSFFVTHVQPAFFVFCCQSVFVNYGWSFVLPERRRSCTAFSFISALLCSLFNACFQGLSGCLFLVVSSHTHYQTHY